VEKFSKLFLMSVLVMTFSLTLVMAVVPFGGTVTPGTSETAPADTADNEVALAGNVTELTITGFTTTQSWQGYFGNVSGTIQLADASDNVMYNWSLADPEGEVYATNATSVDWESIACFDLVTNHESLELAYNIANDDMDGINETFSDSNTHDLFYTNNVQFSAGDCPSTYIYGDTGAGVSTEFQEVLMTDQSAASQIIFASIIEESSVIGFDNVDHDFEMLVLEDGHGTDTSTTTYYFYVELE
jgi:hypothetical protein